MAADQDWSGPDDRMLDVLRDFLTRAVSEASREEIDLPHIVLCRDRESGAVTYAGPFPDGLAALVFAEQESRADRRSDRATPMQFSVAALLPADC